MASDSESESEFGGFTDIESDSDSDISISSVSSNDDTEIDISDYTPLWTKKFEDFHVPSFYRECGPVLPQDFDTETAKAIDYFQLFLSAELWDMVTKFTNEFAANKIAQKKRTDPTYSDKLWVDVTAEEIKAYTGLCILMGVNPIPQYRMYWSKDMYIGNKGIQSVMSSRCYEKITQYLHVSTHDLPQRGEPGFDKLGKIRKFMQVISDKFLQLYKPERNQTIDEGEYNVFSVTLTPSLFEWILGFI